MRLRSAGSTEVVLSSGLVTGGLRSTCREGLLKFGLCKNLTGIFGGGGGFSEQQLANRGPGGSGVLCCRTCGNFWLGSVELTGGSEKSHAKKSFRHFLWFTRECLPCLPACLPGVRLTSEALNAPATPTRSGSRPPDYLWRRRKLELTFSRDTSSPKQASAESIGLLVLGLSCITQKFRWRGEVKVDERITQRLIPTTLRPWSHRREFPRDHRPSFHHPSVAQDRY